MTISEQAVPAHHHTHVPTAALAPGEYSDADNASMQQKAKDHLWMHFSRQSVMESGAGVPIITKGQGHHIWDSTGKKYIDGLSGLFVVNAKHPAAWPQGLGCCWSMVGTRPRRSRICCDGPGLTRCSPARIWPATSAAQVGACP